ncbi:unnamed protein product [Hydatigera taeniaeformis]|uniref:pyridoxal 5'-phosphate synthase n=1 Tax=Hydatigena taeniaeformis TaxID=6205 RepID=A0A0R3XAR1_HYDTA|nr:unnamed protein product [Hydatigera taeniaeformis]
MRIPYRKESDRLHESSITSTHPLKQFQAWFEEAVTCPGLFEANAMVLSTVSKYLPPKGARHCNCLFFFIYANNPNVSLLFYWEPLNRQVRIEGKASLLPDVEAEEYFHSRSKKSQISAYVSEQSKPIESDRVRSLSTSFSSFMHNTSLSIDFVFTANPEVGYAVVPDRMEFWQGQTTRLHDRFLFFRPDEDKPISEFSKPCEEGWYRERLAP